MLTDSHIHATSGVRQRLRSVSLSRFLAFVGPPILAAAAMIGGPTWSK
jgi:hypothetical protein